jgi:hypothetical protein
MISSPWLASDQSVGQALQGGQCRFGHRMAMPDSACLTVSSVSLNFSAARRCRR